MRRTYITLLCLMVACTEDTVTPTTNRLPLPEHPVLMSAHIRGETFSAMDYCEDTVGPPPRPVTVWAEELATGVRFEADLPDQVLKSGASYPLDWFTSINTPAGQYVVRNLGFGSITITRYDDIEVAGTIDANLVHQRNLTDTLRLTGDFSADPWARTFGLTATYEGQSFRSDIGGETFRRIGARVCLHDSLYALFEGHPGASLTIATSNITGQFLGAYTLHENQGFARISFESGGEFFTSIDGTLDVTAVDSFPVQDSTGALIGFRKTVSGATFDFTSVNVIVFGEEDKDTLTVTGGRLSLDGLPGEE